MTTKTTRQILSTLSLAALLGLSSPGRSQTPSTSPTPAPYAGYGVAVDSGVMIPARDGTRLHTDISARGRSGDPA